jgi:hypothetical protein
MITRGLRSGQSRSGSKRLPPGQHLTRDFPVLSAAPTPHTPLDAWSFALETEDGTRITAERVVARIRAVASLPAVDWSSADRHHRPIAARS